LSGAIWRYDARLRRFNEWEVTRSEGDPRWKDGNAMMRILMLAAVFFAGPAAAQAAPQSVDVAALPAVILDTASSWQSFNTLSPPLMDAGGTMTPLVTCGSSGTRGGGYWKDLLTRGTAQPPAGWTAVDFDDSAWLRGTASALCRSPYLERACLRGSFTVTDPAKVRSLTLIVGYYGGAIVTLNGREVARQDIAAGARLAAAYPRDVFVDQAGKLIALRGLNYLAEQKEPDPDLAGRIARRERRLVAVLPADALRPGRNVLAVEIIRAPYDPVVGEQMAVLDTHGKYNVHDLSWNTCELRHIQLRAAAADGLVPAGVRPAGVQVWNSDPMATDFDVDFGNPAEPLRPIHLVGVRGGAFSGKVVVGSDQPLRGLAAKAGPLTGPGGTIPAEAVRVRYATPWGSVPQTNSANWEPTPFAAPAAPLMALLDAPLAEFPVQRKAASALELTAAEISRMKKSGLGNRVPLQTPHRPEPVFGAVVPVWVTVTVPRDAAPGRYVGPLAISVGGQAVAQASIEIEVLDWTLPAPCDFRTWVEIIQSPDTLSVEYQLAPWSERHWQLIERSLEYLRDVGSKVVYTPLIAESNAGNAESMVRWIDRGGGRYDYDFTVFDKYLDVVEKHLGKPRVVVLNIWDRYLGTGGGRGFQQRQAKGGPVVTQVDPATGKIERLELPPFTDPSSKKLWQPLFDQVRARLKARGLEQAMMLGMVTDFWPDKDQVAFIKDVSGNLPWVNAAHYVKPSLFEGLAPMGYQMAYFSTRHGYGENLHGWQTADLLAAFERIGLDTYPLCRWRLVAEQSITGSMRGVGRLGADTWQAVKDKNGVRVGRVWERYPGSNWGYLNCNSSTLAPGPDGPVATTRYEALREGVQECEALIAVEAALLDAAARAKLGDDLAARCEAALKERNNAMWRSVISWQSGPIPRLDVTSWRENPSPTGETVYLTGGWQARSATLFRLAGEVRKKLAQ